jgi:Uma2 family endonuclease
MGKNANRYLPHMMSIFQLARKTIQVQRDILVICDEEKVDSKGKYHGIPTLAIEVLSPSIKSKDMSTKLELYMKGGVNEFWLVDMEEKEVYIYFQE